MRLAQVLYSGLGGHGSVAFSLAEASGSRWRHDMVFVGVEPLLPAYADACAEGDFGQSYIPVAEGRPWKSWWSLYRSLRQFKPEAILLHSVKTILPCRLYAWRYGVPLIAVEHQQNVLKRRSEWMVSRLLMIMADRVVVLTDEYRDQLHQRLNRWFRDDRVAIIPNGIDVRAFSPCPTKSPGRRDGVLIGMASRFTPNKGQETLVDALINLRSRDCEVDWRLSLAGDGECFETVRLKVRQAGLEEYVDLPGCLAHWELADWFRKLDLYAHASDGETLSTALLQAMATGLPTVGSDVPGINNLLSADGGCGLLADGGTADGFATALERLAHDRALAGELAKRARNQVVRRYSQEAMAAGYNGLLAETCGRSFT